MGCQQHMSCFQQHPLSALFGEIYPSVVIPIDGIFNNQAAAKNGAIADFDRHGSSFDAQYLPHGSWVYDGITVRGNTVRLFEFSAYLQVHSTNFLRLGVSERTMCWRTIKSCIYPSRPRFTSFIFCMPEMEPMVFIFCGIFMSLSLIISTRCFRSQVGINLCGPLHGNYSTYVIFYVSLNHIQKWF